MKIAKQIIGILVISVAAAFIANGINPKGIPLFMEKNIYKQDTTSKNNIGEFINDPFDTTSKPNQLFFSGKKNKQGFIEPENISLGLAKQLFDRRALFIDARTKEEYDTLHVKGAINLPYHDFYGKSIPEKTEVMKKYGKSGIIVVYCNGGTCDISIDLAYEIAKLGYNNVSIYKGGIKEWESAGNPVERR
ncbi:MAG: rhodanese-like domain-containing protein [Bacteroidetes bacterium]|nr:rhodanese-like domain-containing protein [Bacteroidota bacterium]